MLARPVAIVPTVAAPRPVFITVHSPIIALAMPFVARVSMTSSSFSDRVKVRKGAMSLPICRIKGVRFSVAAIVALMDFA